MPRKSAPKNGAAAEGTPARRTRSRKQANGAASLTQTAAAAPASADNIIIPHEEIQRLAYFYWLERGGQGGSPEDDWFRAEAELRRRYGLTEKSS
jgi:hypothetical protein